MRNTGCSLGRGHGDNATGGTSEGMDGRVAGHYIVQEESVVGICSEAEERDCLVGGLEEHDRWSGRSTVSHALNLR